MSKTVDRKDKLCSQCSCCEHSVRPEEVWFYEKDGEKRWFCNRCVIDHCITEKFDQEELED